MAAAQKAKFKPFSVETYGGLGKSARGVYHLIQATARDHMMMWPYQQVVEEMRGAVAIAIQRGNAMVMLAAYNRAIYPDLLDRIWQEQHKESLPVAIPYG